MGRKKKKQSKPWCWYPFYTQRRRLVSIFSRFSLARLLSGTATGNSRTRRSSYSTRRPSTSSATSATRSSTLARGSPFTACRCTRRPSIRFLIHYLTGLTSKLKFTAWKVCMYPLQGFTLTKNMYKINAFPYLLSRPYVLRHVVYFHGD